MGGGGNKYTVPPMPPPRKWFTPITPMANTDLLHPIAHPPDPNAGNTGYTVNNQVFPFNPNTSNSPLGSWLQSSKRQNTLGG